MSEASTSRLVSFLLTMMTAPCHLLAELSKNVSTFCFKLLPSWRERRVTELLIKTALFKNGLSSRKIFSSDPKMVSATVYRTWHCPLCTLSSRGHLYLSYQININRRDGFFSSSKTADSYSTHILGSKDNLGCTEVGVIYCKGSQSAVQNRSHSYSTNLYHLRRSYYW